MHTIYDCVNSFCSLLDTEYYLVLGRKGVAVELGIRFSKKDCFHLMGLQYLTDMPNLSRNRGKIFDEIREQKITQKQVGASWTLLYKKKTRLSTGEENILYDRLSKNHSNNLENE